ncbi:MAG: electron transfer flavoprotein subunit alpha/FixB family protein [Bacteroidota bacterium]
MSVLLFAEHWNGSFKKSVFEAASFAKTLADKLGGPLHAVVAGDIADEELQKLGQYGVGTTHKAGDARLNTFSDQAFAKVISTAASAIGAKAVVLANTYNGKAAGPRVAVRLDAAFVPGVNNIPEATSEGFTGQRPTNSGKGVETYRTHRAAAVFTPKVNSFGLNEAPVDHSVASLAVELSDADFAVKFLEKVVTSSKVSITEADIVISGGRGFKGPENWNILEDMAGSVGAGTACSKPVSDMDWRPHHEHVGQTGIQIAPNLYIAIGISGAIQHLAGVNSSKNIVVINKDPEAPFFKIADYGIVGDLFDVVPKITAAIKEVKAATA